MQSFLQMSLHSRSNTKQKRPSRHYRIVYSPISLPENFPLVSDALFEQGDAPITFLHGHDCLEIGYCYEGAGVFVIGEKVLPFQTGDVSFITPEEFHLARSVPGTQSKWAWLYLDPVRLLRVSPTEVDLLRIGHLTGKSFCNIIKPLVDSLLGTLVGQIVEELRENRRGSQVAIRGMVLSLMVRFNRLAPRRLRRVSSGLNSSLQRVAPALDFIAAKYADQLSIEECARNCHVSVTHFRRLFRQALGQSPHQYLTELRVRMAAARLHATKDKILIIAEDVGFATLSSFNRAFRQIMNVTPRQWRTRH
jgi:AraC-like DNA-binding protein